MTPEVQVEGRTITCVCSVGHRKDKATMGDGVTTRHKIKPNTTESSKIPISACLNCPS